MNDIKEKALKVIEAITYPDIVHDDKIGLIYKFAHIALNPSCIDSHNNWIKELDEWDKFLKEVGMYD